MKTYADFSRYPGLRPIKKLLVCNLLFVMIGCGGSREPASAEELREYEELQQLLETREFQIENEWMNPQSGQSISLTGHVNFIRFQGDSVEVYLPYYGIRHSGGGIGTEGGIKYEGPLRDLEILENKEERRFEVNFDGSQDNEQLQFYITLYPNKKTTTRVNTSQRSSISYRGEIVELEESTP